MGQLDGRVALVTGGGRGIGRGICELLAVGGRRRRRELPAGRRGGRRRPWRPSRRRAASPAPTRPASTTPSRTPRMVDAVVADFGAIDILVNNAGVARRGNAVADTDPAEMTRVDRHPRHRAPPPGRLVLPSMRTRPRGDIVMISSVATSHYAGNGAPYNMGKAALEALAFTLAKEERPHGIHVNVVAPGLVETDMGVRLARAMTGVTGHPRRSTRRRPSAACASPSMSPTSCCGCAARAPATSPASASSATAAARSSPTEPALTAASRMTTHGVVIPRRKRVGARRRAAVGRCGAAGAVRACRGGASGRGCAGRPRR